MWICFYDVLNTGSGVPYGIMVPQRVTTRETITPPTTGMYDSTLPSKKTAILSQFGEPKRKNGRKCLKNLLEPPTCQNNI